MFLALAALLPSCRKADVTEEPGTSSSEISFRVTAVPPASDAEFKWTAVSDRIGVFARESGSDEFLNDNAYYDAYSSTGRSLFTPLKDSFRMKWEDGKSYDIALYYPWRKSVAQPEAVPVSAAAEQVMDPASPTLLEDIKQSVLFAGSLASVSRTESGQLEPELSPVVAFVRVRVASKVPSVCSGVTISGEGGSALSFEKGSYDLFSGKLSTGEETSSSVTVRPETPVSLGGTPSEFWAKVNPSYSGTKLTIVCSIDGEDMDGVAVDIPEGGLTAGRCLTCEISLTDSSRDLSQNGSANTYIVSRPGLHSFTADVKGNGIARGFDLSFEGEAFSRSYDVNIHPHSAALLWHSTPKTKDGFSGKSPVDPDSVYYSDGRIYFNVPADFEDGNAVIAAFDEAGEILWSWNIWALRDYDADAAARRVGRYLMMDRNLGAVLGPEAKDISDKIEAAGAIGNYYQWGRKDPFPAAPEYSDATSGIKDSWGNEAYTGIESFRLTGNRIFSDDRAKNGRMLVPELGSGYSMEQAIGESAKYPHKWIFGGTSDAEWPQYGWFNDGQGYVNKELKDRDDWRYLWGSLDNVSSVKTIYDPCPPGWKVPTADAYASLGGAMNLAAGQHGVYNSKYDLYFPYAGQRKAGFGGSVIVGNEEIMIASASVSGCLYPFRATAVAGGRFGVTNGNSYIGAGLQLRCVREDVAAGSPSYGRQNGHRAALMGDSITRTWRDRGRKLFFTENNYANFGIDGTTSSNMIGRFASQVLADDPSLAVIACGTNDFAENDGFYVSIEDLLWNIALMARMAQDEGAEVVLGAVAPSRSMWWKDDAWKAKYDGDWIADKIVAANRLIKAYAESHGFKYADYHTALKDEQNGLAQKYMWAGTDSVHPNYDAFIVMEGILKPLIDALLYDPDEAAPGGSGLDDLDRWEWK